MPATGSRRIRHRRDHGASAVEFALLLPLLFLIVAGIIDFGLYFNAEIQLSNSAQEGARMAALGKPLGSATSGGDDIWTRAKNASPTVSSGAGFSVRLDRTCPAVPLPTSVGQVTVTDGDFSWVLLQQALAIFGAGDALPQPTATAQVRCS